MSNKIKLSILICSIPSRQGMLKNLLAELEKQIGHRSDTQIVFSRDEAMSVGEKRNWLLSQALGRYVCYIDDDDRIAENYIDLIMGALKSNPDCCSLKGIITTDGADARIFIHSNKYTSYFEENAIYYRPPNHLNVIRASIARRFKFPDKNFSEDTDWAMEICRSGLLKKEAKIEEILYYYKFISNKNHG